MRFLVIYVAMSRNSCNGESIAVLICEPLSDIILSRIFHNSKIDGHSSLQNEKRFPQA